MGTFFYSYESNFPQVNLVTLPFNKNTRENYGSSDFYWNYIDHYDSFLIKSIRYKDVYEIETVNEPKKWKVHTFYSTQSGLIKYAIKTDTSYHVYELIDSKVIH